MPVVSVDKFTKNAMGIACGVKSWAPDDFWRATPFDVLDAWQGFEKFHGLKPANDLSPDDVRQLRELLNENINGV